MTHAVVAALLLGALMTFGDFVWAAMQLRHRLVYGLVHGVVVCLAIGAAIGVRERQVTAGLIAGPLIGLLAAGSFYLLAPWLRYNAMFISWMLFWICFALLQARLRRERSLAGVFGRGLAAAVLSGLAFYAISGIWTRPSPGGPDYVRHLASWTFAFFPGFAVLFVGGSRLKALA